VLVSLSPSSTLGELDDELDDELVSSLVSL